MAKAKKRDRGEWAVTYQDDRIRKLVSVTMSPSSQKALKEFAESLGHTRSVAIEACLLEHQELVARSPAARTRLLARCESLVTPTGKRK